jgi:hypothetical protein
MDQWTALSVNYLFDKEIVKMNKIKQNNKTLYTVSGNNDYQVYSTFNRAIENIAKNLSQLAEGQTFTPEEAEVMIFSEGRGKGLWRTHLLNEIRAN